MPVKTILVVFRKFLIGSKHPELFVDFKAPTYCLEGESDPYRSEYSINHAIVSDGHFNGPCSHRYNKFGSIPWDPALCSGKTILAYPLLVDMNHWTLVVVDRVKRSIEYYDSKMNYGENPGPSGIVSNFEKLAKELAEKDPGKSPYRFERKIEKKLQPDRYQCGPWILYFLEERLKNPEVNFNRLKITFAQKMIAEYRIKVMKRSVSECIRSEKNDALNNKDQTLN